MRNTLCLCAEITSAHHPKQTLKEIEPQGTFKTLYKHMFSRGIKNQKLSCINILETCKTFC